MARPTFTTLAPGTAGWDTFINDLVLALTARPLPPVVKPDAATLDADFDPALYQDCLVVVQSPSRALYISDGTSWTPL